MRYSFAITLLLVNEDEVRAIEPTSTPDRRAPSFQVALLYRRRAGSPPIWQAARAPRPLPAWQVLLHLPNAQELHFQLRVVQDGENGAEGAHGGKTVGHDQLALDGEDLLYRPPHACVRRDPAYEGKGASFLACLSLVAFKVAGQCEAEPGDQLVFGCSYLLQVDHVGLGENRAPPCDPGRLLRLQGGLRELLYGEAEAGSLLVQEGAVPAAQRVFIEKSFTRSRLRCLSISNMMNLESFPPMSMALPTCGKR